MFPSMERGTILPLQDLLKVPPSTRMSIHCKGCLQTEQLATPSTAPTLVQITRHTFRRRLTGCARRTRRGTSFCLLAPAQSLSFPPIRRPSPMSPEVLQAHVLDIPQQLMWPP